MRGPEAKPGLLRRACSGFNSLSLRLFLWLAALLVLAFATHGYLSIRATSRQWEQAALESARSFSDLIQSSTHYSMLLDRKEDVRQAVRSIARDEAVHGVRIYDKQGTIVFSGDAEEIGRRLERSAEACAICHAAGRPPLTGQPALPVRIFRNPGGDRHRVLELVNPIENAPACSSASCHAHTPDQTVLGVLDVQVSLARADAHLAAARRLSVIAAVVVTLLVGIAAAGFIYRLVRRPVKQLIVGSQRVAGGDLSGEIRVGGCGEIGQLADAFNNMTRDLAGAREQLMGASRELERKVAEKTAELAGALEAIQDLERRKSHYMRISAHQLRSPLATILTSIQVLTQGHADPASDRGRRLLEGALRRTEGLLATVNDLLELAKIREGQERAPWESDVDLGEMLREVVEAARPMARKREVSLVTGAMDPAVLHRGVVTDLRYALENVVDNALKYSRPGGEARVDLTVEGEEATLTVADQGIGIPAELQEEIFEEFVRAPNAKHHAEHGTGLGLTIVREAVERHGGTVSLESEAGRGTTVTVALPLRNAPPPDDGSEAGLP